MTWTLRKLKKYGLILSTLIRGNPAKDFIVKEINMKIAILVVVYNKQLFESQTLTSLIKLLKEDKDKIAYCRIVNNGPTEVPYTLDASNNFFIDYIQSISNRPLSMIYNDFINDYNNLDRFVILDDDSELTKNYIDRVYTDEYYDLELPKVYNYNKQFISPLQNWKFISTSTNKLNINQGFIVAVGSGLIISKNLIVKFKEAQISPFNENFSLYGVDSSLFFELRRKIFKDIIITSYSNILHDLSLHGKLSSFKTKEFYINIALQMRHYPNLEISKSLFYSLYKSCKQGNVSLMKDIVVAYLKGIHPNCSKHNRNSFLR